MGSSDPRSMTDPLNDIVILLAGLAAPWVLLALMWLGGLSLIWLGRLWLAMAAIGANCPCM